MSLGSDLSDGCHHEGPVVSSVPGNAAETEATSTPPHTTEGREGPTPSDGTPRTSTAIIDELITRRTEALWKSFNEGIKVLRSDQELQGAIQELASIEYVENPPGIRFPEGMAFLDLLRGQPKGGFAHARVVALLLANQIIMII